MKNDNLYLSGMMGLVTGDALGVPVEGYQRNVLDEDPVTGMREYGTHYQRAGTWSDDSSMAIASLESLQRGFDTTDMMNNFVKWYHTESFTPYGKVFDIGRTTHRALDEYETYHNVHTCGSDHPSSNGNGSLMRILPVCIYAYKKEKEDMSTEEALSMIHEASALTHAHPMSLIGCGLYYFCMKALLEGTGWLPTDLQKGIDDGLAFYNDPKWEEKYSVWFRFHYQQASDIYTLAITDRKDIKSSGYVMDTLTSALWCLLHSENYKSCELLAVNLGGDTDSIAAVTGGLAGLIYGYEQIPEEWLSLLARRQEIEELCREMDG